MKIRIITVGTVCALLLLAAWSRADDVMHPILTISGSGSRANTVTNIAESAYTNNFIPHSPPRNSAQGFVPAVVAGDTGWSWSSSTPNQIISTPSGTIFPNANPAYPLLTQAVTVFLTTATNNLTKTVNAVYYNKAGSTTSKSMVLNLIDYNKLNQLRGDFNKLAPAYINSGSTPATRNDNYARRIAIALLDWGRWHPGYYLTAINSPSYINVTPNYLATTGGFGPQRASDHNGLAHEWQTDELSAFDAIYNSVVLTNMNAEMGIDVRQYICDNLFFDEGDFLINHITVDIAIQSNLSGPYAVLPVVARVLNRPDYIQWMDTYLDATVRQKIRRDGALEEGEGYSIGYLNANQDAAQNTHDYFLTRPATNSTFLAISNRALVFNTTLTYGQGQWSAISLPSGQLPAFGDTPYNNYFSSHSAGLSALMPSYGTLSLGAGSGSQAFQLNQNFSGDNNHMRADMCAFVLWAFNNPYLDDIRYYNGSIGRNFGEQMLAYNTITIDRSNLSPYADADTYGNGDLTIYEPGNNGLAMTEIDGQRSYSSKASRFQRLLLMNTVDLAKPYVVDVFRVTGGTTHDYTFHGAMLWNQTAQTTFPLVTNSNPYPMLEGSETWNATDDTPYYGFWRNVNSNSAPGNFQITYTDTGSSHRDTRLWMTADPNVYTVYLGTTPVPARNDTVPTNFFNSQGLVRPSAIIRHRITSGTLQDLFVSVVEPMNVGASNIVSVSRLPMSGTTNESVGLKITFKDGRVDTYIVNLRNSQIAGATGGSATVSTADGQYSLTGRVGLEVDRTGGDSRVWTMNATDFKYAGRELTTPTNTYFSGLIAGSTRKQDGGSNDAFTTTSPLPVGTTLRNKWLSFTHGALSGSGTTGVSEMYKIDQVVFTNGLYSICFTNDHMLRITNGLTSGEQVAPLRTFTTSNSFELTLSAAAQQISAIADQNIQPGGSAGPLGFSFGNLGTTAGASLQVLASSANQTLIPNVNLIIGGSGTNRNITITSAAGQTGASVVTISVTDGIWTNSRSFNVGVANFAVTTTPSFQSVLAGNSVNFTNVLAATNGTSTVSFSVSGLPAGASASFNPATTAGAGTNTLSVTASNGVAAGSYPLAIFATDGNQMATNTVTLVINVVNPTPGWSTWLGGSGTGSYWSDAANWSSSLVPGNSLAFSGIIRPNNTNDTAPGTTYSNIIFNAGASAFTLSGNPVTVVVGVTNSSAVPQTIALGINFSGSIVFNGASNAVIIAGGLTNTFGTPGSTTLTLAGTGTIKNLLKSTTSPGGTNVVSLNSGTANWTLADNDTAAPMTVPWSLLVYNGTFNFGTESSAPTLTSSSSQGVPNDNEIGRVAGVTGTFNMNAGTFTTATRINTGTTVSGSTGIVNQVGGTLNIGNQFQGANTAGGNSMVNVSGGVMNINGGTGVFYVASRGNGILTVSDTGAVNCGKLDISRNAAGNTSGSAGTVNLDGGTLSVTSVTNLSANIQTGGSPTATFNFNGGTLVAKSGAAPIFFQGTVATPVTPIKTYVKLGGAIIDDGGNAITIVEPLQHDATLGGTPDGGLTKLNTGTLTLAANGSYSGDTVINAGTLALTGNGSITNSGNILLAAGTALNVSGRSDGKLTLAATQTLSGLGTVAGNMLVNGAVSPGADVVGTITNTGAAAFGAGGRYNFDLEDAVGDPGTNWDFLSISGTLGVQATSANPFVIKLRSIDGNLNDGNPGVADFGTDSSQNWVIATAAGGITNFSADKFTVDTGAFANDLAGGTFSVQTNGNSLLLVFTSQPTPPVFGSVALIGTSVVVSGDGGVTGGNYYLLASTNLNLPLAEWVRVATNQFGVGGSFMFTNDPDANGSQLFYRLMVP